MYDFLRQTLATLFSLKFTLSEKWTLIKCHFMTISDVDIPEIYNPNLLHLAAKSGDVNLIVKVLGHQEDYDINLQDKNGWTPLHIAIYLNHNDMVRFLLDKEADFYIKTFYDQTALSIAVDNLNLSLTIYLLSKGAEFKISSIEKFKSIKGQEYLKNLLDYANSSDDIAFCDVTKEIEQFFKEHQKLDDSNDLHLEDTDSFFVNYDKINSEIKADLLAENPIHSHQD